MKLYEEFKLFETMWDETGFTAVMYIKDPHKRDAILAKIKATKPDDIIEVLSAQDFIRQYSWASRKEHFKFYADAEGKADLEQYCSELPSSKKDPLLSNIILAEAASTVRNYVEEGPDEVIGFIDCSGSNGSADIISAQEQVAQQLGVTNYYYFTDKIYTSAHEVSSYSTNYTAICDFAKKNLDKTIIVLTDGDVDGNPGSDELKKLPNVKIERIEAHLRKAGLIEAVDPHGMAYWAAQYLSDLYKMFDTGIPESGTPGFNKKCRDAHKQVKERWNITDDDQADDIVFRGYGLWKRLFK